MFCMVSNFEFIGRIKNIIYYFLYKDRSENNRKFKWKLKDLSGNNNKIKIKGILYLINYMF